MDFSYSYLVLVLPFVTFLFLGLMGTRLSRKAAGVVGTTMMGITAVIAYTIALDYFFGTTQGQLVDGIRQQLVAWDLTWLEFSEKLVIKLGFLLDPISAMMLIVITTVSFLVHLYSLGYMQDHHHEYEKGLQRYYAFLSLFSLSMLGLVVAPNIFQMYIFWELVGVSSYLLIGFYYTLPAAVSASKKAFIVTRFADLGFLVGILILSFYTQTFDFITLTSDPTAAIATAGGATFMGCSVTAWALTLIFMGGAGKSAMFPLHIWLPDAMEGPTPVSALIHAATMVVAGVYLIARMFPLYCLEEGAMTIITVIGAFTAFYAAAVACVQSDIKRVLAFSTISQIAFMVTSLGVARPELHDGVGYMASMFHLFTHAMFKALLFLCAGAIIHAVHSNEMSAMGGLRKYMPICNIAFLIGCLAIAGIPPFAGFFSKDEILVAAFLNSPIWGVWMMLVAGMTAFYMFRLYYKIFWWNTPNYHHTPHDGPMTMSLPLIILSGISIVAGFVPFGEMVTYDRASHPIHMTMWVAISSVAVAVVAILLATKLYLKENEAPAKMKDAFKGVWTAAYNRFYMDELYQFITHKIIFERVSRPLAWFDRQIVDGSLNMLANITNSASYAVRKLQSGNIQAYVYVYLIGALLLGAITVICLI
ncbi:MAG: NADH-quinone oxidoreductase subunit L [Bacteroidales bacterium]|nr:NADH-quinone oxidoreductase subunit L [Bacteroidales bacterium]